MAVTGSLWIWMTEINDAVLSYIRAISSGWLSVLITCMYAVPVPKYEPLKSLTEDHTMGANTRGLWLGAWDFVGLCYFYFCYHRTVEDRGRISPGKLPKWKGSGLITNDVLLILLYLCIKKLLFRPISMSLEGRPSKQWRLSLSLGTLHILFYF